MKQHICRCLGMSSNRGTVVQQREPERKTQNLHCSVKITQDIILAIN